MFKLPDLSDIQNEAAVEQKLIYPLLTADQPFGFNIASSAILTKQHIKRVTIGKGDSRKSYFPDYLIHIGGIPLVVIEAKDPTEDIEEAFHEARLYATEINSSFHSGVNPLTKLIVTNGKRLLAGAWDSAKPKIEMVYADFNISSERMAELHEFVGRNVLELDFARLIALSNQFDFGNLAG